MFRVLTVLTAVVLTLAPTIRAADTTQQSKSGWRKPPEEVMEVLHAPQLPTVWTAPTGEHLLLADPVLYPPLAEMAGPMHVLAGMRVDPTTNNTHGRHGATSPRLVMVEDGAETPLDLPKDVEVHAVSWTVDGQRFALTTRHADHMGLWVGSVKGDLKEIEGVAVNQLLDTGVRWMPDQQRLLVRRVPKRGAPPQQPAIPAGPEILEGKSAKARSTYEARNLLETAHDDALFSYYTTTSSQVV